MAAYRPRLGQPTKEYVVGEVRATKDGSGMVGMERQLVVVMSQERLLLLILSPFNFVSYRVKLVDKAGRLLVWCDESEEEEEKNGGLES